MSDDAIRDAVLRRLDLLDHVADGGDPRTVEALARTELHRLAEGWRLLLTVHQPDHDRRCQACPRGWRGKRWPCQVWRMAHRQLIGDATGHRVRKGPSRHGR
ncbi:hypothetical protein EV193_111180 [Herbihabitans rhizosphaerae]|uniref:Uncharacterized protein n=1 Tax=Herbihabitans rhizosphaerae TaxID=1872711 RepID=A0A4Q7KEV6_9PSEU|nr:hypothetical protein [Herbihabitans rhizosphaerae]RZS32795.1 hypothetical protein EV193_111180 [Herbihabitans rhizosphaerae]